MMVHTMVPLEESDVEGILTPRSNYTTQEGEVKKTPCQQPKPLREISPSSRCDCDFVVLARRSRLDRDSAKKLVRYYNTLAW